MDNNETKCIQAAEAYIRDYQRMMPGRSRKQIIASGITHDVGAQVLRGVQLICAKENLPIPPAAKRLHWET